MCLKVHPTEANDEDLNDIQYEFKHFLPRVKGAFFIAPDTQKNMEV